MTREELKAKIDELIGLESELVEKGLESELRYVSPIGVLLFAVIVYDVYGEWRFGGQTGAVPELWRELASIHRW